MLFIPNVYISEVMAGSSKAECSKAACFKWRGRVVANQAAAQLSHLFSIVICVVGSSAFLILLISVSATEGDEGKSIICIAVFLTCVI